jgi:single-strand DNA-binding protein
MSEQQEQNRSPNGVYLRGNLGADPFERKLTSGVLKVQFSLAVTERYKNRAGEDKEETTWVDVECWEDLAHEVMEKYKKGSYIEVFGRIRKDVWDDKDNPAQKRSKLYVRAHKVVAGDKTRGSGERSAGPDFAKATRKPKPKAEPVADEGEGGSDIPF